jgi:alkanesulfonate monooxygenase SsuD/methylene tetrahydromethanopterin reductase-like flavin-dependent oxidoreductase (luciferase family)
VISRGRLVMGFVKGVPYEPPVANSNPVRMMDRLWEAHDLILDAMTSHDGPFAWEGKHFNYRNVNIWPRPWQQPHPPVWITGTSLGSALSVGKKGYTLATFLTGYKTKSIFDEYRRGWSETQSGEVAPDRFAYLALGAVAASESEAQRRANEVMRYVTTTSIVAEPFRNPPGYASIEDNVRMLKALGKKRERLVPTRTGSMINIAGSPNIDDLIAAGLMFAGTPDQVYRQIIEFDQSCGGFDNLLLMLQAGALNSADTEDSLKLFGREVLPRLKEYSDNRESAGR